MTACFSGYETHTACWQSPGPVPVLATHPPLAAGQHEALVAGVGHLLPGVKQDLSGHEAPVGWLPRLATLLA